VTAATSASMTATPGPPAMYQQDLNPFANEPSTSKSAELPPAVLDMNERTDALFEEPTPEPVAAAAAAVAAAAPPPPPAHAAASASGLPAEIWNAEGADAAAAVKGVSELPAFPTLQASTEAVPAPVHAKQTPQPPPEPSSSSTGAVPAGKAAAESASSPNLVHAFAVVCPDGTLLDVKTEHQVLGRGIGGIRSKKVSREQARVIVNFATGTAELEVLGKNPGATRPMVGRCRLTPD